MSGSRAYEESKRGMDEGARSARSAQDLTEGMAENHGGMASNPSRQFPSTSSTTSGPDRSTLTGPGGMNLPTGGISRNTRSGENVLSGGSDVAARGGAATGGLLDRAAAGKSSTGGDRGDRSGVDTAKDTAEGVMPKDHHGGMNPLKAFTSKGAVGSQFNPEGPVGSIPQKVGGPFDKEGAIGKQFTSEGVIGGTVDKLLGEKNTDDPLGRQPGNRS